MDPLGPRTFLQKLQASRGHTEDDSLGVNQLFRAQPCQPPCSQRAPESAKHTGRMQANLMKITTYGAPETGISFHRQQVRKDNVRTATSSRYPKAECRCERACGNMHDAVAMGVVKIESMYQRTVHQNGITQRKCGAHTDYRNLARRRQPF